MSSTEPPSRIPPRGQSPDSKQAREEISSKGKVEKVREVDADETRKKKKWLSAFNDEDQSTDETAQKPNLFDLAAGRHVQSDEETEEFGAPPSLGENDIVPSPAYTPPPDVSPPLDEDDEATTGALPQSEGFWEDVDFPPDQAPPPTQFQERTRQTVIPGGQKGAGKKGEPKKGKTTPVPDTSLFGPAGKPTGKAGKKGAAAIPEPTPPTAKKLPSPFEEVTKTPKESVRPLTTAPEKGKKGAKEKAKEEELSISQGAAPMRQEEREGGGGGKREGKRAEIISPSLPGLPTQVQPTAEAAVNQAVSYLHPSTVSLFYQMVGTIAVMTSSTPGINRTEIVLNNPAYSNSKFFGSTITIEKYATAPDSFNIRLTGSDTAVTAFRENIPSLMTAFQNGNFDFRVNRLDVEYSIERPVFRRKEKGEEKGEAGGGDLGERRK